MLEDVIKFTWKKVEQTKPYRDEIENSNWSNVGVSPKWRKNRLKIARSRRNQIQLRTLSMF